MINIGDLVKSGVKKAGMLTAGLAMTGAALLPSASACELTCNDYDNGSNFGKASYVDLNFDFGGEKPFTIPLPDTCAGDYLIEFGCENEFFPFDVEIKPCYTNCYNDSCNPGFLDNFAGTSHSPGQITLNGKLFYPESESTSNDFIEYCLKEGKDNWSDFPEQPWPSDNAPADACDITGFAPFTSSPIDSWNLGESFSKTITGLKPDTWYSVAAEGYNQNNKGHGESNYGGYLNVKTMPLTDNKN